MLTITSKNLDEMMAVVRRELGQLPVLRARNEELEDDLMALFSVHETGAALPREFEFRLREMRESYARKTREKLSKTG